MAEKKCYAMEIISDSIENFNEEMDYIYSSLKCNKGFVGIHIDKSQPIWRNIALFDNPKDRNLCYKRINDKFGYEKPRAALILEVAMVDEKYLIKSH